MSQTLFLSTVTKDYGRLRARLGKLLGRLKRIHVRHQDDFIETGELTLLKLKSEVEESELVLHVIGGLTGSMPPVDQVEALLTELKPVNGKSFEDAFPEVVALARKEQVSYTQWEAWLGLYLGKTVCRYRVEDQLEPDADDRLTAQQQAQLEHAQRLVTEKVYPKSVADAEALFDEIIATLVERNLLDRNDITIKPNNLPHTTLGELFKGREEFLKQLAAKLHTGTGAAAITADNYRSISADQRKQIKSTKPQTVTGSGGIGKTRAAIEYAWQHEDEYSALLFVTAESPEALRTNLAQLVGILGMTNLESADDDARLAGVLDWLKRHPGWLVILDNVDTPKAAEAVKQALAHLTDGHLLITSRLGRWSHEVDRLEMGVLSKEAATEYLLEAAIDRHRTDQDSETALAVALKVGQLALGLEHAKAYVNQLAISFAEYLQQWDEDMAEILREFDRSEIDYPRELLVTWRLSVDRLSDDSRKLLEMLAWFAPDPIPESVLENLPDGFLSVKPRKALAGLADYSLVTRVREQSSRSFFLHRLVQATTRHHLVLAESESELPKLPSLETALFVVNKSFVGDPTDVRNWPSQEPLLEHAQSVCDWGIKFDKTATDHPVSRLLNQTGLLLKQKIRFVEAEDHYRRALQIDEASFGTEHQNVAIRLSNLAQLLKATNRLAEAEPLMRRALQIDEAAFGTEHPRVAVQLNNLAQLLEATNRLAEAEPLMRRALQIDESSFGTEHPKVAIRLNNLAQLLQATNRLAEAEPLMRRALQIDEAAFGTEHPRVAVQLNNLAQLLEATNRLAEAEPLMRRALQIDEASYGAGHPDVARDLNNLASLLQATNRLKEAEPLMRRALQIDEASYGAGHPDVARDLNNLALLLQATNRLKEAEPLMRRALQIDEASYGAGHPDVARDLNNLAQLLQATNRLEEAEPLMRRALQIDESSFGTEHPIVAIRLNNLAQLLQATNRLEEAEPLMRRALQIDEASFGTEHPNVARDLNNLAQLLQATNRLEEAEPLMRRALQIDEASYGAGHPDVAIDLNNLAQLLQATNRLEEAEPLMRRALQIFVAGLGADHPNSQTVAKNFRRLLKESGKSDSEVEAIVNSILRE